VSEKTLKIVITGGSGFIGKWLINLLPKNWSCVVLGQKKEIHHIKFQNNKIKYIFTDYSINDLKGKIENFDAMVHLAGIRTGPESFLGYNRNIEIAANILAWRNGTPRNIVAA